jgi:hypothetical protein
MTSASFHWGFFVRLGRAEPANAKSLAALARLWGAGSFTAPQHWGAEFTSAPEVVQTPGIEPGTS